MYLDKRVCPFFARSCIDYSLVCTVVYAHDASAYLFARDGQWAIFLKRIQVKGKNEKICRMTRSQSIQWKWCGQKGPNNSSLATKPIKRLLTWTDIDRVRIWWASRTGHSGCGYCCRATQKMYKPLLLPRQPFFLCHVSPFVCLFYMHGSTTNNGAVLWSVRTVHLECASNVKQWNNQDVQWWSQQSASRKAACTVNT